MLLGHKTLWLIYVLLYIHILYNFYMYINSRIFGISLINLLVPIFREKKTDTKVEPLVLFIANYCYKSIRDHVLEKD
jgi:hypothetical protein